MSQFNPHRHSSSRFWPKSNHLVVVPAKLVVRLWRIWCIGCFKVEFSAYQRKHDLHLHHRETLAQTCSRTFFETTERVFRLFVAGEEAVRFEGEWILPEVSATAYAVMRNP